ncbi:hypothetical protein EDB89DRAFT_1068482 [Lactarius sanguifluus]|nr:hypothetical protein EDB89DRAFT_1068482 [Lactarius sanguifluus]
MRTQSHCPVGPVPLSSFAELLPSIVGSPRMITQDESHRQETTIYVLPDNVLLEIFDSCKKDHQYVTATGWKWCFLAHVCRRWRQIVFESPQRLNLQIHCTFGTPVRKSLGIWPPIPIAIDFRDPYDDGLPPDEEDNVMAALEHPGRVCYLRLRVTRLQLEKMAMVMQEPFPALTHLNISLDSQHAPVLPAEFLGGSAPCLRKFHLTGIPFPALPTLLMSASNLVFIFLQKIPPTGYISPEAMVACLATLHRLETFIMKFQLATPPPQSNTLASHSTDSPSRSHPVCFRGS